jgi:two-component system response regulator MprA
MGLVLIIEDDHDIRVTLRSALEAEGFSVFSATNGAEGYRLLQSITSPVVVILDQNMPLSSGDDFMRLRNKDARTANIPIIALSAVDDRVSSLGAVAYLRKPVDLHRLVGLVRKYSPSSFWGTAHAV